MLISVTRLRLRSPVFLPMFAWQTFLTQRQVVRAAGFIAGRLLVDAQRTFWTMTAWETEQAMRSYRISGTHAKVMPRLQDWCDEASVVHWTDERPALPSWTEGCERMRKDGRPSRVRHPSPRHEELGFPDPRLQPLIGQALRPKR